MVITTDKSKYNQNDDINIGVIGGTEWTEKNIIICKGNSILKTITIDGDSTSVNLDNTVGLIDIYMQRPINKEYSYSSNKYNIICHLIVI